MTTNTTTTQQETLRTLETLRQRLNTTATSLSKLRHDLETTDPLPQWPSLLNSMQLLQHNYLSLQAILANNPAQAALKSAHVYPLPLYPGRTQESLLEQLLRKRVQPGVEDWIEEGKKKATFVTEDQQQQQQQVDDKTDGRRRLSLDAAQLNELWDWAGPEANRIAREDIGAEGWDDVFTLAENEIGVENVVTGLRRKLWESDGEDEDEDDDDENGRHKTKKTGDEMDVDVIDLDEQDEKKNGNEKLDESAVVESFDRATALMKARPVDESRAPLPLEHVLRYSLTGQLPLPGGNGAVGGLQIRR